mmetsp:Transcript_25624/g.56506  ORF Transcript_25624/g.56506 Transcript_25624/m.56506 type:complete len:220 (-) Transcript_25624:222-881(-)|eukprot:CAMPEP_0170583504 /NCGR_PEP_ID=MMETSP0224-20130122/8172_1 /TAXON_ID=285029 /ORGANISM="Togula jolla, Strain CCCM 725" /LENGTH=219 /DNA_ID=CAMNT_0010906839 /DNA_START=47 /DNA_END=706 /DNA_ORIENTATION=+
MAGTSVTEVRRSRLRNWLADEKKSASAVMWGPQMDTHCDSLTDLGDFLDMIKPVLVVCQEAPDWIGPGEEQRWFQQYRYGRPLEFSRALHFTRWLFQQPRGAVKPWVVLVTDWREAQPCATAIEAARSGSQWYHRSDPSIDKLPELLVGKDPDEVFTAVGAMLVIVRGRSQERAASSWVMRRWQAQDLPITIARPGLNVAQCLESMANSLTPQTFSLSL